MARKLAEVSSGGYLLADAHRRPEGAKNKLSEYVRLAASGETVVITDCNRIAAEIVPPRRDTNATFLSAGCVKVGLRPNSISWSFVNDSRLIPGYRLDARFVRAKNSRFGRRFSRFSDTSEF